MQHPDSRGGKNDLPFASCYEPAAAAKPPATAAPPAAAAPAPAGVCIMRRVEGQFHPQIDPNILHQAGLKTRQSASCIPDLILTTPTLPAPLAIMVITSTDPAHSLDSPAFLQRCASMVSTFRTCAVALPHFLGSHPTVLQLACDSRYKGKIQLHYMCPGDNPAHTVLQLVACCSNSPQAVELAADAWNMVMAAATAPDAIDACMAALATAVT